MNLTENDKKLLLSVDVEENDFPRIWAAMQPGKTKYYHDDKRIGYKEVIRLLGRKGYLSGLARSAVHWTAVQEIEGSDEVVYFDSSALFRRDK